MSEGGLRDTRPLNRREQREAALQATIEKASASAALLVAIQSALQANWQKPLLRSQGKRNELAIRLEACQCFSDQKIRCAI